MTEPATIAVPVEWLDLLLRKSSECADELEARICDQYPSRHEQPLQKRRFDRDMTEVNDIRDVVARVRSLPALATQR